MSCLSLSLSLFFLPLVCSNQRPLTYCLQIARESALGGEKLKKIGALDGPDAPGAEGLEEKAATELDDVLLEADEGLYVWCGGTRARSHRRSRV
jgi:hypothetical protein